MNDKITKKNKKVVILGTAPSVKDAPYDDPSFDIWGVAHCCFLETCKRLDEVYELHQEHIWREDWKKIPNVKPFSRFPDAKIYMVDNFKDIKNCVKYPYEEITKKYGKYWTNSPAFMIALAIERGYEEIHVYGIHFLQDEEFFFQRPCFEYYLGIAQGKGIKVYIAPAADILKFSHIYGYDDVSDNIKKINARILEFDQRGNQLIQVKNQGIEKANAQINYMNGGKFVLDRLVKIREKLSKQDKEKLNKILMGDEKIKIDIDKELEEVAKVSPQIVNQRSAMINQLDAQINQLIGAKEDCKYFLKVNGDVKHMLAPPKIGE